MNVVFPVRRSVERSVGRWMSRTAIKKVEVVKCTGEAQVDVDDVDCWDEICKLQETRSDEIAGPPSHRSPVRGPAGSSSLEPRISMLRRWSFFVCAKRRSRVHLMMIMITHETALAQPSSVQEQSSSETAQALRHGSSLPPLLVCNVSVSSACALRRGEGTFCSLSTTVSFSNNWCWSTFDAACWSVSHQPQLMPRESRRGRSVQNKHSFFSLPIRSPPTTGTSALGISFFSLQTMDGPAVRARTVVDSLSGGPAAAAATGADAG